MTIQEFAKMTDLQRSLFMYRLEAKFIEKYNDKDCIVQVYSYNDFFIEVLINIHTAAFEIIPFKRGYRLAQKTQPLTIKAELAYCEAA